MTNAIIIAAWLTFMLVVLVTTKRSTSRIRNDQHFNNYIVRRFGDGHPDITRK